jgi:GT2 family glycosyltransferase
MNKILIASPTYDGMEYCFKEFIEHIKSIDYLSLDILIIDNSRTKKFFRNIRKIPRIKVIYDDTREEKNIQRLISSRNKIINYAMEKNYDYLLMMDSDVMVPSNILNRLLSHNRDVCSGLYFNYFKVKDKFELLPVCYRKLEEKYYPIYKKFFPHADMRMFSRQMDLMEANSKELFEVSVPSSGCVLLSRKAFSSGARYGLIKEFEEKFKSTTDDLKFFKNLREEGFKIYCDTSVLCAHNTREKYERNKLNHPIFE